MAASSAPPAPRLPSVAGSLPSLSSKTNDSSSSRTMEKKSPAQSLTVSTNKTKTDAPSTKKSKKSKKHSPFRIKVGCIVALRYRANGNNLKGNVVKQEFYSQVWTDPQEGRDDGLALIGQRIRCCFPKSVLEEGKGASTRILEGEVVSLLDYEKSGATAEPFTSIELLVEKRSLEAMPFLQQTNEQVDVSTLKPSERKRQQFEDIIRGKDMITVKVNLACISGQVDKETASKHNVAKWVIRKRIPKVSQETLNGTAHTENGNAPSEPPRKRKKKDEASSTMYVGDKNDSQAQQERNWRWLAGNHDDMLLASASSRNVSPQELSCGMIGEVLKVEPRGATTNASTPKTLAVVTLRRMILPQHTKSGRQSYHGPVDIFDDADAKSVTFQVPVEELVIISRKSQRKLSGDDSTNGDSGSGGLICPIISRSYSYSSDTYYRLGGENGKPENGETVDVCHRCRKAEKKGTIHVLKLSFDGTNDKEEVTCPKCQTELEKLRSVTNGALKCDCRACRARNSLAQETLFKRNVEAAFSGLEDKEETNAREQSPLALAQTAVRAMQRSDFDLPNTFMFFQSLPEPSEKPIAVLKPKKGRRTPKKAVQKTSVAAKGKTAPEKKAHGGTHSVPGRLVSNVDRDSQQQPLQDEEEQAFVPTCSRLTPYDPARKRQISGSSRRQMRMENENSSNLPLENDTGASTSPKPTSSQKGKRPREPERVVETKSTSRAARADQRRLKRGVAALGASGLGLDALAGREQQLRFDRSSIHAWGVFADEDINAGDMVVEYRGELIGNTMAEKREVEYEKAKIGSDYMFRIDAFTVCDATKQGNVARFINASCDPNCYTQIITMNGNKRIVIYAKKDIKAGEELCYDYKFPFEFEESRRIPCHCGAKDCRGFMNWDKRYVKLPAAVYKDAGQANKS